MKVFLALLVIFGSYMYLLLHTANLAITQTQQLGRVYQYVGEHSDQIATGQPR